MKYNLIAKKVSKELGIPESVVRRTYIYYWAFIKNRIESVPMNEDMDEETFNSYRPGINIPSLGKFVCTYEKYSKDKERLRIVKELNKKKDE